jgi:hypothetical protein
MELEASWRRSQELPQALYLYDPFQYYSRIYAFPRDLFPSGFPIRMYAFSFVVPCVLYVPPFSPCFDQINTVWWREQIIDLIMQFSLVSCYFHTPRSKFSIQQPF